jgi:sugar O-acyltransferase (sialic acid O-acetyltransferase NeuD family)
LKEKLIIVGDGEFAEFAFEYFTNDSPYEIKAFTVEKKFLKKEKLFNLPIVPFEQLEEFYSPTEYKIFIAITYTQLNRVRTRLYHESKKKGFSLVSYIHSNSYIASSAKIGENCFIEENCSIQYNTKIGNNVFIGANSVIGHSSTILDNCFVSFNVGITGMCKIGENSFLGVNSCLQDNLKIAEDTIIGAGAVVLKDTEKEKIYVGNPAKALNKNSLDVIFWRNTRNEHS